MSEEARSAAARAEAARSGDARSGDAGSADGRASASEGLPPERSEEARSAAARAEAARSGDAGSADGRASASEGLPPERPEDLRPTDDATGEELADEAGSTQVRPARGRQSVTDMVRSMALVVGLVVVGVFATVSLGRDPVLDVDYTSDLAAARTGAPYDIYAPVGLEGWRTTSVRFGPVEGATVWHLGFVAPSEEYVGVDETDGDSGPFIADLTENATDTGAPVTIGAEQWTRYDGGGTDTDGNFRGLAFVDDGLTVLVSGTAGWDELEEFARALSTG